MIEIPILQIPNQSFSIRLSDHEYDISLISTNGCMSATIVRDGQIIVANTRVVSGFPIIPYSYLESGNFAITTDNDDLPDYTQFGISQFLIYATETELGDLRAGA